MYGYRRAIMSGMALPRRKSWLPAVMPILAVLVLTPQPGRAIPAFARKYGVKCYTCHTMPPALNKTGYLFKRLGYRRSPGWIDGNTAGPKNSVGRIRIAQ